MSETRDPGERAALYLGGALSETERKEFERDLLQQDEVAEAFYDEMNLDEMLRESVPDASERKASSGTSSPWRVILPLAASLAILFLVPSTIRNLQEHPAFRSGTTSLTLRSPIGDVDAFPREFVWDPDPSAHSYEIVVTDEAARVVVREITTDTHYAIPDDLRTDSAGGFWTITARDANGFEITTSKPERFRVRP